MMHTPVPDQQLRAAVEGGNVPTLLAVLIQLSGDAKWRGSQYRPTRSRGMDDNHTGGLPELVQQEIRAAAVQAIQEWQHGKAPAMPDLHGEELMELMDFVMGEEVPHEFGPMMAELMTAELRTAELTTAELTKLRPPTPRRPHSGAAGFSVVVIGSGISGMLASIKLTEAGIQHVVLEKNAEVGGSWWENRYPGAGVDTPSYLYSYSFFPRSWSTHFGKRDEVQRYLSDLADAYDLRSVTRFGAEVVDAVYDDAAQEWAVTITEASGTSSIRANAVITAVGLLNRPKVPPLPGLDTFDGAIFHSARWPQGLDLTGKRVAIVGSGASAMQIGPAIAGTVDQLTVFQRSPQWIAPNADYFSPVTDQAHWLMENVPAYRAWYRVRLSWIFNDKVHPTLQVDPNWPEKSLSINEINHGHRAFYTKYLTKRLAGRPDLVAKSLPNYPPFGKRMLLDNGWYTMLTRPNVELVTEAVTAVTPAGLISDSGTEREFDVVILATGFHTDRLLYPMDIVGRSGRSTREIWGEHDAKAYLGITVPDFPNLFITCGPNTALGHGGSYITIAECQVRYIVDMLATMVNNRWGAVECRPEVNEKYNAAVDDAHSRMVWAHPGMTNWYRNDAGRVVAVLPWRIVDYWTLTRTVDPADFVTEPSVDSGPSGWGDSGGS